MESSLHCGDSMLIGTCPISTFILSRITVFCSFSPFRSSIFARSTSCTMLLFSFCSRSKPWTQAGRLVLQMPSTKASHFFFPLAQPVCNLLRGNSVTANPFQGKAPSSRHARPPRGECHDQSPKTLRFLFTLGKKT